MCLWVLCSENPFLYNVVPEFSYKAPTTNWDWMEDWGWMETFDTCHTLSLYPWDALTKPQNAPKNTKIITFCPPSPTFTYLKAQWEGIFQWAVWTKGMITVCKTGYCGLIMLQDILKTFRDAVMIVFFLTKERVPLKTAVSLCNRGRN